MSAKAKKEPEDIVHLALGDLSPYQILINVSCCLIYVPVAWQMICMNFLGPKSEFTCLDSNAIDECNVLNLENNRTTFCQNFEHDKSYWSLTVRQKWDLVCENDKWYNWLNSIFMSGVAVGVIGFGVISDRFGRKITSIIGLTIQITATLAAAFTHSFGLWVTLRWIAMASSMSILTVRYVLGVEFLSGKNRAFIGVGFLTAFPIGIIVFPIIANFLRNSFHLQLIMGLVNIPLLISVFFVPESPRWLIGKGRFDEAEAILRRGAKFNGRELPLKLDFGHTHDPETQEAHQRVNVFSLFKTPRLRLYTLCAYWLWFGHGFVYYGIALNIGNLGGDLFLNTFIFGAVDIPAFALTVYFLSRFRRREVFLISMVVCGTALLCTMAFDKGVYTGDWPIIFFAMMGKFCLSLTFTGIYLYTVELYPVLVRNVGMGSSSTMARVGSILAPMSAQLKWVDPKMFPTGLLGLVFLTCASVLFLLPETFNKPLLKTIDELENGDYKQSRLFRKENKVDSNFHMN